MRITVLSFLLILSIGSAIICRRMPATSTGKPPITPLTAMRMIRARRRSPTGLPGRRSSAAMSRPAMNGCRGIDIQPGTGISTSAARLSSRKPRNTGWRNFPSWVIS